MIRSEASRASLMSTRAITAMTLDQGIPPSSGGTTADDDDETRFAGVPAWTGPGTDSGRACWKR